MTREEIISGLKFTVDMFLTDISGGETKSITKEQLNDLDRTTVDACEGAIEFLKRRESAGRIITEAEAAYCENCDHVEMCSWYGTEGCELKTKGMYERGYNDAKREIALSGEYERCYERGKADAEKKYEEMKAQKEPCEDAISREAVRYYIESHIHEIISESGVDKNEHTNRVLRAILNGVETMPSVQPARAKGKWIFGTDEETGEQDLRAWTCSICEMKYPWQPNFCPNCGAEMEAENGREETEI